MHTETLSRPWRLRGPERGAGWLAGAALITLAVLLPLGALAWQAAHADLSHWSHLARSVLPQAFANTAMLLAGVGLLVTLLGAEIGRASCRERVCQYVEISVVTVSLK